jgi:DNA-binding LacI/PurR family transcriptional regulator
LPHPRRDQVTVPAMIVPRTPTMTDVALLAGVSHQTVSRVLNGQPNVRPQTRLRVLAATEELGYRPNRAAQTLVTGKSQIIGVVAQNTTLYGPASLLAAFGQVAGAAGFGVAVAGLRSLDPVAIAEAIDRLLGQQAAGVVVLAPVRSAQDAIEKLSPRLPLVAIDGDPAGSACVVTVDQVAGARLATQHLLDAGHATVWHISGPADWFDSMNRIDGWRQTLAAAGREAPPPIPGDWSPAAGYRAGQLLARIPEVTAVFAANDHLALGLLKALREHGRLVPDDVSIVGFDDIPEAAYLDPELTTIRPDFEAVAQETLDLLLAQIQSGQAAGQARTIGPALVVRKSVGPPPGYLGLSGT